MTRQGIKFTLILALLVVSILVMDPKFKLIREKQSRRLKSDELKELWTMHFSGRTQAEIAKHLGCSQNTISYHLNARRERKEAMGRSHRYYMPSELAAAYNQGEDLATIAQRFGISKSTASNYIRIYRSHDLYNRLRNEILHIIAEQKNCTWEDLRIIIQSYPPPNW